MKLNKNSYEFNWSIGSFLVEFVYSFLVGSDNYAVLCSVVIAEQIAIAQKYAYPLGSIWLLTRLGISLWAPHKKTGLRDRFNQDQNFEGDRLNFNFFCFCLGLFFVGPLHIDQQDR
ncbi:hypothetical protein NIES970_27670 (plasmid) [[Synechococcus] sp. NIES-970]|nr:hypothetical protein NIES970_27670 [[Synechococcus] sp. NIES-970]